LARWRVDKSSNRSTVGLTLSSYIKTLLDDTSIKGIPS